MSRFHTNDNIVSLLHLTIGSLLNKLDDTEQLQSDINHKLTIIGISETWLNDKSESLIQPPDYSFVKNFRKKKTGGFVGMFISTNINKKLSKT